MLPQWRIQILSYGDRAGGGGGVLFTFPAGFSRLCHFSFFTQYKGGAAPRAPPLDPPLASVLVFNRLSRAVFLLWQFLVLLYYKENEIKMILQLELMHAF